ncbi:MAG TPA: hydrolase [Thermoanaerobaculia bacterium]|nr:hydrolase [Thermoanaerobaculia bacterium]
MPDLSLDPHSTALVLIDLQRGIVARQTAPYTSADVVAHAVRLADRFRQSGGQVVLVRVTFSADNRDRLTQKIDSPQPAGPIPPDYAEIVLELGPKPGDILITKRQWGAFYGTELDLQLRRRHIDTIVLGGISTNFGVESTARAAHEHSYQIVFAEDAMAGLSAEAHQFAVKNIFPRLGLVRSTAEVLAAITGR